MIRLASVAGAVIVAFTLACSGSGDSTPTTLPTVAGTPQPSGAASCSPPKPYVAGDADVTLTSGGIERTYIVHVPPGYVGDSAVPLVVLMHGLGQGARLMLDYSQFVALADREGFVVASLQATGDPAIWNADGRSERADDLTFVADALSKLEAELCVDPDRVYVAGYSNGGGMTHAAACALTDRIAAVALIDAVYLTCRATPPLIAFHGTLDPLVPFDGGVTARFPDYVFPPVRRAVSELAVSLGCDGLATISRASPSVELSTYRSCTRGDGEALLYTVVGGGHTWPGAVLELPPHLVGATNREIDATGLIWAFFVAHPLAH